MGFAIDLKRVEDVVEGLPWDDLEKAYQAALDAGQHPNEAAAAAGKLVDDLVDFRKVVHGPAGELLEASDAYLVRIAVRTGLRFGRHRTG